MIRKIEAVAVSNTELYASISFLHLAIFPIITHNTIKIWFSNSEENNINKEGISWLFYGDYTKLKQTGKF